MTRGLQQVSMRKNNIKCVNRVEYNQNNVIFITAVLYVTQVAVKCALEEKVSVGLFCAKTFGIDVQTL